MSRIVSIENKSTSPIQGQRLCYRSDFGMQTTIVPEENTARFTVTLGTSRVSRHFFQAIKVDKYELGRLPLKDYVVHMLGN